MSPAKTPAQRQAEYRRRKTEAGEPEVRGIYAPKDSHDAIRLAAKAAVKKLARANKRDPAR